jgi:hypothetical protein
MTAGWMRAGYLRPGRRLKAPEEGNRGQREALWRFEREGSFNREQRSPDFCFGRPDAGGGSLNSRARKAV